MPKINNARTFGGTVYVTKNVTDTITGVISVSANAVEGSVGYIVERLIGTSATSYKLNPNVIPDLAITQVYIWDASAATVTGTQGTDDATLLAGIKTAITANGVQRGDVVIVTSDNNTDGRADLYAGSYIFIEDVAAKANIVAANWKRMYVPTGHVRTVNSLSPDAGGNVNIYTKANSQITIDSIALASKSWISDGVDDADRSAVPAINGTSGLANKSLYAFVKALNADLGATSATDSSTAFGKLYNLGILAGTKPVGSGLTATVLWNAIDEIHNLITDGTDETGTIYARLDAIEESTGTGDVGTDITNIKTDLGTIESALEGACKVVSVQKSIPNSTQTTPIDGVAVSSAGVVTITGITGIVLAVVDAVGEYVGPDIVNAAGSNTLTADFGGLSNIPASYNWTIYYTSNPSITLVSTAV